MSLIDPTRKLVTLPGDRYVLKYNLPGDASGYEFFLESRGYYLEWIRQEWIAEENPYLLAEEFITPRLFLKRVAPEFKAVEKEMEICFWNSRYEKQK